jgi:hypothetical protein
MSEWDERLEWVFKLDLKISDRKLLAVVAKAMMLGLKEVPDRSWKALEAIAERLKDA